MWAAINGHEGIAECFLEREDVTPNTKENFHGLTALGWAATRGHDRVAKLLLQRGDINPNILDTRYGRTPPLAWAAIIGYEETAKLLLEREDINLMMEEVSTGSHRSGEQRLEGMRE